MLGQLNQLLIVQSAHLLMQQLLAATATTHNMCHATEWSSRCLLPLENGSSSSHVHRYAATYICMYVSVCVCCSSTSPANKWGQLGLPASISEDTKTSASVCVCVCICRGSSHWEMYMTWTTADTCCLINFVLCSCSTLHCCCRQFNLSYN